MLQILKVFFLLCLSLSTVRSGGSTSATPSTTNGNVMATGTLAQTSSTSLSVTVSSVQPGQSTSEVIPSVTAASSQPQVSVSTTANQAASTTTTKPEATTTTITTSTTATASANTATTTEVVTSASSNETVGTSEVVSTAASTNATDNATVLATTTPTAKDHVTTTAETTSAAKSLEKVCGVKVENIEESSACHPTNHRSLELSNNKCHADELTAHEWIRFTDSEESCKNIPMFSDSTCFKPGECGSQYPYYLSGCDLPEANQSVSADLCTTVSSKTGSAYCCEESIDVEIMNCNDGFQIYRLSESMSRNECGKVCLSENSDPPKFSFIVEDGDPLPETFDELDDSAAENLVAVVLVITNITQFKNEWVDATEGLQDKVKEQVETVLNNRQKRSSGAAEVQVEVLDGYPEINIEKNEALYVLSVRDGDGNVIPKASVEAAIASLENADPGDQTGSVIGKVQALPKKLRRGQPTKPTAKPVIDEKGSTLWIAIIIIVGVTAFIVALTFVLVWCYSYSRKGKFIAMNSSQHNNGLVGDDELNSSYKVTGHINVAMEDDDVDKNQNSNDRPLKKSNNMELERVDDNSV
ncbi:serine-rich adhesin for platelets-like [Watersipora subatra]|uniref:serine-rich adhesin for platelets-like n=1 Tax=Watersipora subatra TaxID=2589382 RepID=UPI00355C3984